MSAHVPGRSWFNSNQDLPYAYAQGLVIEPTVMGERSVDLWVAVDDDGPVMRLTAGQAREVAAELVKRADLIAPGPVDAEIVDDEEKVL